MSLHLLLSLITVLTSEPNVSPLCNIEAVNTGGVIVVQANVQPLETGVLTYKVDATVITGSNKSRTVNGGEVEIRQNLMPSIIWQGRIGISAKSRISIILEAQLNDTVFSCDVELP